jgi:hypothetical protein
MAENKTKTKIWHGGLSALLGSAADPPRPSGTGTGTGTGASANASTEQAAPLIAPEARAALLAPQPASLPSSWQAVTRILPIEQLFPNPAGNGEQSRPSGAVASVATATAVPSAARLPNDSTTARESVDTAIVFSPLTPGAKLRAWAAGIAASLPANALLTRATRLTDRFGRERLFLYGGLLCLVLALLFVRVVRSTSAEQSEDAPVETPRTEAENPPPIDRRVATGNGDRAPAAALPSANAAPTAATGLERAAADALARGDYAGAQRIYTELAKSTPEPSVYSEAARILSHTVEPAGH